MKNNIAESSFDINKAVEPRRLEFTPDNNVIPGNTPELRIERYLLDHPSFHTPSQIWPSDNHSFARKMYPVVGYDLNNALLWRVIRLSEKCKSHKSVEVKFIMGIPTIVTKIHKTILALLISGICKIM